MRSRLAVPETAPSRPAIHVVAGLVIEDDRVCVTRRADDTHQGGKWEFPGGKLEPQEDPLAGLKRELLEELGITVQQAEAFMDVRHDYGDLRVRLDVWRIIRYGGTPHGREAQPLRWVRIAELDPHDFPDADQPVLRRLQLPALYLLSDVGRFGKDGFTKQLARALEAGARMVQLREPDMGRASFTAYAREIAELCHGFDARLLVNADPAWVDDCSADGAHLNSRRLHELSERPLTASHWVGASCHDERELAAAQRLRLDFVVLGPVQPTASHPEAAALGWERFRRLCAFTTLPVYAIGGMRADHYVAARTAGAHGLAMISGVWGDADPKAVVRRLAGTQRFAPEGEVRGV
jgi:8-oxo-dGTP diphosphatase